MPDATRPPQEKFSPARKAAAWSVHALTATGAAAGLMAMIAITQSRWKAAFVWMGITLLIDSVDGTLARLVKVKDVLPRFDGALLDNIVDYFTYVIVPAFLVYEAGMVPARCGLIVALAMTLASGYQFGQVDAKTDDHCFLGFPSYWNVVVFYLFLLPSPPWLNFIILMALAVAVFIPSRYLYPSRTPVLRRLTFVLTGIWTVLGVVIVVQYPDYSPALLYISLVYVGYYFGMSFYLTARHMRRRGHGSQ